MNEFKQAAEAFLEKIRHPECLIEPVRQSKLGYCFKGNNVKITVANNMKDCYGLTEREFGTRVPHSFGLGNKKYVIVIK